MVIALNGDMAIITLHTNTTVDGNETDALVVLSTDDLQKIKGGKRVLENVTIFADADMSAANSPNFDIKVNLTTALGDLTIADTSTGTSMTTDGVYLLEPSAGFQMSGAGVAGMCMLPLPTGDAWLTVDYTEVSGTGSIVAPSPSSGCKSLT